MFMDDSEQEPVFTPLTNQRENRNWAPMAGGAALVLVLLAGFVLIGHSGKSTSNPGDLNLKKLQVSDLHMATAQNFAGGSVTYIEGKITNTTDRKVTDARVEVVFKNSLGETAQKDTLPVTILLRNAPYIDYGPIESAPLAPGQARDFRLTLEHISTDWDGQIPQVRVVTLEY
jgi:hypothetical protein